MKILSQTKKEQKKQKQKQKQYNYTKKDRRVMEIQKGRRASMKESVCNISLAI